MSSATKIILGLVGAAAAGVVVGLLMAPEKGTDMRKKVSRTAGDWAGQISDLFANSKGEMKHLKDQGKKAASGLGTEFINVRESYS
jgi:gas vesicle protein